MQQDSPHVAFDTIKTVVTFSELVKILNRIKRLECAFKRKTFENEIHQEAVESGIAQKWIA